jgi:hypothetical protein
MNKPEITITANLFYAKTTDIIKVIKQLEKTDWSQYKDDDIIKLNISGYERNLRIQYNNAEWIKFYKENPEMQPPKEIKIDRYEIRLEEAEK